MRRSRRTRAGVRKSSTLQVLAQVGRGGEGELSKVAEVPRRVKGSSPFGPTHWLLASSLTGGWRKPPVPGQVGGLGCRSVARTKPIRPAVKWPVPASLCGAPTLGISPPQTPTSSGQFRVGLVLLNLFSQATYESEGCCRVLPGMAAVAACRKAASLCSQSECVSNYHCQPCLQEKGRICFKGDHWHWGCCPASAI